MEIVGKKPVELLAAYDQAIGIKHNWREWQKVKPEANRYVLIRVQRTEEPATYNYSEALLGDNSESLIPTNIFLNSEYEAKIKCTDRCEWIYTDEI